MKLRKENDPQLAQLYFYTGNQYYMHKQHPTAILYMKKAEIYLNSNDNDGLPLANTYEAIASIYINLGNYEQSLSYANQCLSIREKKLKGEDENL